MAGKGGATPGAGRKRNADRYADKIAGFTDECANHLKPAFWRLWELVEGGERVEVKRIPSGLLTRKDVARDADGNVIRDDKGKPIIVDVKLYPAVPDHEPVEVERKVITLQPDIRAIAELLDRVMGKARQAVELTGQDGDAIRHAVTIYLPDNGRDSSSHAGDPTASGAPGDLAE